MLTYHFVSVWTAGKQFSTATCSLLFMQFILTHNANWQSRQKAEHISAQVLAQTAQQLCFCVLSNDWRQEMYPLRLPYGGYLKMFVDVCVFCFGVTSESMHFVPLCSLGGQSQEQTRRIKFICLVQTVRVCRGSRAGTPCLHLRETESRLCARCLHLRLVYNLLYLASVLYDCASKSY